MPARNFPQVVHAFLGDRRCAALGVHEHLGRLYTEPNFDDAAENHLRAAALAACKPAVLWLRMCFVQHGDEGFIFDSLCHWSLANMTLETFQSDLVRNVNGYPIWRGVEEVLAGGCPHRPTEALVTSVRQGGVEPGLSLSARTIWVPRTTGELLCVEGNRRLHALAHDIITGRLDAPPREWSIWQPGGTNETLGELVPRAPQFLMFRGLHPC